MRLESFFNTLDHHVGAIPIDKLVQHMQRLELAREDVAGHVRFEDEGYGRNLVRLTRGYAALILCWRDGQRSPIHNHAGSACGVKVLDGVASETQYERNAAGDLEERDTYHYPKGHVCGSFDDDIHEMYNAQGNGRELITLHVYTPPLNTIEMYCRESGAADVWTDYETQAALREMSTR